MLNPFRTIRDASRKAAAASLAVARLGVRVNAIESRLDRAANARTNRINAALPVGTGFQYCGIQVRVVAPATNSDGVKIRYRKAGDLVDLRLSRADTAAIAERRARK